MIRYVQGASKKYIRFATLCLIIAVMSCPGFLVAQTLTIYESEKPASLDPYMAADQTSKRFVSLYCRPLFQFKHGNERGGDVYEAVLADPMAPRSGTGLLVTIAKDAYAYRYVDDPFTGDKSRDSIKITAHDVLTTYHNIINPESQLPTQWFRDRLNKFVEKIEVLSDDSLWVVFKSGMIPFPPTKVLDFPIVPTSGVPDTAIQANPAQGTAQAEYALRPWGGGPFIYKGTRQKGGSEWWVFERTKLSHGRQYGSVLVKVLDYQNMQTVLRTPRSDADICIPSAPIGLRSDIHNNYRVVDYYSPSIEQIVFNTRRKHLSDWRIRAALSVFIDRNTLVKNYNSEADLINGPFPKKYWYYCDDCDITYHDYNPELGRQLLSEAGWIYDSYENKWTKDGKPLKITILGYSGAQNSTVSEIVNSIAAGWQSFGIDASSETLTRNKYNARLRDHDFDAAFHALFYENQPRIDRYFLTGGKDNYSGLSDSTLDALWQSLGTVSIAEIRDVWYAMHERVGNIVPSAFLWTPHNYAVHSSWVDVGHEWYPFNFIGRIEKWKYEE